MSYCLKDECAATAAPGSSYCEACAPPTEAKRDTSGATRQAPRVGLAYDVRMCGHEEVGHPECPQRITSIHQRLQAKGLVQRCVTIPSRQATDEEILSVHSKKWLEKTQSYANFKGKTLQTIASEFNSIYMNDHTMECALLSAGLTAEITKRVCEDELDSGVAIVRPPGHHAESHCAMGFCIFNNVAMAAQMALSHWGKKRVAIIDWDVHHGNGTQNMFYDSKGVLYFSVHRFDQATFYPGSRNGGPQMVGKGEGEGFNINVGWNESLMGDEHYKLCFQHVVVPILTDYKPDLILISAGFDAARDDPLGGCDITPAGYAALTSMLTPFGKVVMVLEGGYNLNSISESFAACTEVLVGDRQPVLSTALPAVSAQSARQTQRMQSCVKSILQTIRFHSQFWPSLVPFSVLMQEYAALMDSNALKKEIVAQKASPSTTTSTTTATTSTSPTTTKRSMMGRLVDAFRHMKAGDNILVENDTSSSSTQTISTASVSSSTVSTLPSSTASPATSSTSASSTSASTEEKKEANDIQEGFAAPAKNYCPHVNEHVKPLPASLELKCAGCANESENWICLSCHMVGCGRHAQGHMAAHVEATGHMIALGYDDLSFWCYQCDSYLHHLLMERVFDVYVQTCELKFGERPPAGLFQGTRAESKE